MTKRLFILAIISIALLAISQLFGTYFWPLELASHFAPYYAIAILLSGLLYPKSAAIGSTQTKRRPSRFLFLVVGVGLLLWCLPNYQMIDRWLNHDNQPEREDAFIVYQNVNITNPSKADTLSALTQHNPEVLILLEAGGEWLPHIAPLEKSYQTHCGYDEASPFSMQIYARESYSSCSLTFLPNASFRVPLIKLSLGETIIYAVHPPPPIGRELAEHRVAYLQWVRDQVLQESILKDIIVIGDFNTTVFSPEYRRFMHGTKLQRTTSGGVPTWSPFKGMIGLGIDHYFTTMAWHKEVILLGWEGSDHRGFLIK